MDLKWLCLVFFVLGLVLNDVQADLYNLGELSPERVEELGLKCTPGRTVIKFNQLVEPLSEKNNSEEVDGRREHMTKKTTDETCRVCVCSAEGKDEYCSNRPARNINECIRMTRIADEFIRNVPFNHERTLAYAIRRGGGKSRGAEVASRCKYVLEEAIRCAAVTPTVTVANSKLKCETGLDRCEEKRPGRTCYPEALVETMWTSLLTMITNEGLLTPSCIPFVSEYNDCNERMTCKGCNKCSCDADGQWTCYRALDSCADKYSDVVSIDDDTMDNALSNFMDEITKKEEEERRRQPKLIVPLPPKKTQDVFMPGRTLEFQNIDQDIASILRFKRSVDDKLHNNTKSGVKFYHTVDEIDEDTLRNSSLSGTLGVQKVNVYTGKVNRRMGVLDNPSQNPLHIEYNEPKIYNHHITDNKIDSSRTEDKYDAISHEKLHELLNNHTQKGKDKDLSKVVVNELKTGAEIIGDNHGPIMSNITFTQENDTLTAMAFIAGNLLNKLWNIERDSTDDSIETEVLKHQKIADLIELFKEPMTYRQEKFLKDALEKLSDAMNKNKDVKNISLCETVEEIKKGMNGSDEIREVQKCDRKGESSGEEKSAVANALSKINNVLKLIKKFENVQNNIHSLKNPIDRPNNLKSHAKPASVLTKDEKGSLDLFGNILEKVTKLLVPKRNSRIKDRLKNQNILSNSHDLNAQVKKTFNIDLDNMKLTPKDKLVLDYITRIETKPCILSSKQQQPNSIHTVESDILLNLSEFFKIKSFSDLLKVVDEETHTARPTTSATTTEKVFALPKPVNFTTELKDSNLNRTLSLKDKLKIHLKTIVNDLIEIQNEKGGTLKPGDLNIADALPCLFNMLSEDNIQTKPRKNFRYDLIKKAKLVLDTVRRETKKMPQTRRNNANIQPRPKSAVVWERLVKNLEQKTKPSRRNFKIEEPKSYEEVKKNMDHIESEISNTYKNFAFLYEVPAAEKLVLLETLELDIKRYINALEKLRMLNYDNKLPGDKLDDVIDFVDNAAANINLNEKVLKNLDKPKQKRFRIKTKSVEKTPVTTLSDLKKQIMKGSDDASLNSNDNMKLTRGQVLNQLIKNRVEMYLRMKETEGVDTHEEMKYNIAKRIIENLENGNHRLAQELFKVFIGNRKHPEYASVPSQTNMKSANLNLLALKKPLNQFQESKSQPLTNQDLLLKQLLNMKNLRK